MSDVSGGKTAKQLVIERATHDADFRAQLKEDPKAAMSEMLGIEFEDGVEVVVTEEGGEAVADEESRITLALPAYTNELSEDALEAVAGGFGSYRLASTRFRRFSVIQFNSLAFSRV